MIAAKLFVLPRIQRHSIKFIHKYKDDDDNDDNDNYDDDDDDNDDNDDNDGNDDDGDDDDNNDGNHHSILQTANNNNLRENAFLT
uniref:Uncharacterized protein n=1 Tax=Glossina morsitans morsitans TaxID=37546 RepID=A0A1B0FM03_GLOMM